MHESSLVQQRFTQELRQLLKEEVQALKSAFAPSPVLSQEEVFDTQEACDFLHIAKSTLYNLVHRKAIPHLKRGRKLYFSRRHLSAWLMEGRQPVQANIPAKKVGFKR
ncbi:MAG: helix-turn-helix domain-containing protein [Bacteroidota bacterium]